MANYKRLLRSFKVDQPFWEKTYQDDNVTTFGIKPNRAVEAMWEIFDKDWSILEVGCGEGKNAIFLAEKGFKYIDAFDVSQAGIDKLLRIASQKELIINAWVCDLLQYTFPKPYDLIISFGTLHFVEKEQWKKFILKLILSNVQFQVGIPKGL
ncbi:MAG TPA: class I SAM-dependent methyltransferase [Bacillota bacterium]|nr:class I SAM-dependent methyltransferase [Bacillota bacterium]